MKNELERAAFQERRLLDKDAQLLVPDELVEGEALIAELDRLLARADALNQTISRRLAKEAEEDPEKAGLLRRFRRAKRLTVKLAAF